MLVDATFEIVRGAVAALPALHVNDRTERALIGAAAPEIDAGERAGGAPDVLLGEDRHRLVFEPGQLVHAVIERLQRAVPSVEQDFVETTLLRLAREERDAERLRRAQFGRHVREHREAARHVKSADAYRETGIEKRRCQIDGSRKLIGLDAD